MDGLTVYQCKSPGLSGAGVYIQKVDGGFEARQAVAFFGSFQMPEEELEKIDYNPFHEDFHDNFSRGIGKTEDEAIQALKKRPRRLI